MDEKYSPKWFKGPAQLPTVIAGYIPFNIWLLQLASKASVLLFDALFALSPRTPTARCS